MYSMFQSIEGGCHLTKIFKVMLWVQEELESVSEKPWKSFNFIHSSFMPPFTQKYLTSTYYVQISRLSAKTV